MNNFALRCFDALCYNSKAILCKWVKKPCKYFIAEYEKCTTRNGVDMETYVLDLEFLLFLSLWTEGIN